MRKFYLEVFIVNFFKRTGSRAVMTLLAVIFTCSLCIGGIPAFAEGAVPDTNTTNAVPVAKNLEYNTFKGVAITGKFEAVDPDGDPVAFKILTLPKKGDVTPSDDGSFLYTPKDGKSGSDTFTYQAVDAKGGVSNEATVKINIKKQGTKLTYADMQGNSAYYAALTLADDGVFTGQKLGDEYFFRPDEDVTRGEFLAMCMKLCQAPPLTGVTRTGFSDDSSIPQWLKPYVSAALMDGIITGYKDDTGRLVFSSQSPITYSEAAVLLNSILKVTDVVPASAMTSDDSSVVPAWASAAVTNLSACDVLPVGVSYGDELTRADAANLLLASSDLIQSRGGDTSLLGWAK